MRGDVTIGLLGFGTVGTGVVRLLERHAAGLRKRLGRGIRIGRIAVRDPRRARSVSFDRKLLTTEARSLVDDPAIDIVVELMGGLEPARSLVLAAIDAGKDVVTANKALLARHGREVFEAAERRGVRLGFEGSVAGGVPIIRTLKEALAGDRNRSIYGIVNGTCNSILTTMTDRGGEFADALAEAQSAGLAEADPSLDVDGMDAAQKLSLLVMLAFGAVCPVNEIHTEGIRGVTQMDIGFARELGYVIRLLAIARDDGRTVEARVHPTMIQRTHLLADVRGAFNAIHIQGEALGPSMYVGLGAGMLPTATSVTGDIIEIARERVLGARSTTPPLGLPWRQLRRCRVRPIGDLECEYYLRFLVLDRPGVLGRIAGILGRHHISIASVLQRDRGRRASVPIVIRTHEALEQNLRTALREIAKLSAVRGKPVSIRIEDRL
jgi:homoserine dehydrogenase